MEEAAGLGDLTEVYKAGNTQNTVESWEHGGQTGPRPSMYGIVTYLGVMHGVNVCNYSRHVWSEGGYGTDL